MSESFTWTHEDDEWVLRRGASTAPSARLSEQEYGALASVADHNQEVAEAAQPTRADRGGQQMPVEGAVCVQDAWTDHWGGLLGDRAPRPQTAALIAYTAERKALGVRRYGRPLETHNGRDALVDAFEEAFDLVMYLGQAHLERGEDYALDDDRYPESPAQPVDELLGLIDLAESALRTLTAMLVRRDGKLPEVTGS